MTNTDIFPRETLAERAKVMLSRAGCVGVSILSARTCVVPDTPGIDTRAAIDTCASILGVQVIVVRPNPDRLNAMFQRPNDGD